MQPEMNNELVEQERARRRQLRAEQVQRRRVAFGIVALGLIILAIALAVGLSGDDDAVVASTDTTADVIQSGTYSALLIGAESVPPVTTVAEGTLDLTYNAEDEKLTFILKITKKLTNPTVATIYQGTPGASGDAVYTLYVADDPNEGTYQGTLAEGTIIAMDLIGPLEGGTIADLLALIEDGEAYVSVGNESHPVDAIRGQIEANDATSTTSGTEPSDETNDTETSETTEPED
ncbi:MAG: CHRD domain-containing protein [Thermoleophilia bacterium]|nr:CHRD domain-containing protein [Thermoleophilia bacterium]